MFHISPLQEMKALYDLENTRAFSLTLLVVATELQEGSRSANLNINIDGGKHW
jgi:hypothetical protein